MLLDDITLNELISFNKIVAPLDKQHSDILESDIAEGRKNILLSDILVQKASIAFNTFSKESTSDTSGMLVDSLILWYADFMESFNCDLMGEWWNAIGLYQPELTHLTPITFGQFIDAKMIVEAGHKSNRDRWEVVQYLMAIFLIGKKKKYDYLYTHESNPQFIRCGKKSVALAVKVSKWWDMLNNYVNNNYTVFQDSKDPKDNTANVEEHMESWGWVNFLKSVAKTKAFDFVTINGDRSMNSIDCVRETRASEVLVWASEEKDYNVAVNRDMRKA